MNTRPENLSSGPLSTGKLKLFSVAGVVVLAVVYLVMTATQASAVYYLTVSELQAQGDAALYQHIRISGDVVDGTIERDGTAIRFVVRDEGGDLPVSYKGVVPDIFGPEVQVVVEGKLRSDGVFEANTLLAKCPSKFESDHPQDGT